MNHTAKATASRATLPVVRCAVYTRKSTEEGLEQEFNSLDAQREAGEAYVASQRHEGWSLLPDRYDDGGFTGGNMDRPALRRLMADIEAGKVDAVIVYKVDRLSRSLLDFARMMGTFDKYKVSFVSVTQQFNTATSMGRLVLNVLLSFAQFEREIISERTRDKIAATRRRGKWSGGRPLLGYDVDPAGSRLRVNEDEATMVRAIFDLYLEHEALLPVVRELESRGWANKRWRTKGGKEQGGSPFDKSALHRLLTNVAYAGKVRYKDEIHGGEHPAVVDPAVFERVQALLRRNGRTAGAPVRNKFGALLKGLLRCGPCGCAMTPSHSTKNGTKRYRYYVCTAAVKKGWQACPSKSVPAEQIERFVVEQLRCVGRDPALLAATAAQARGRADARLAELDAERRTLERELARWQADVQKAVGQASAGGGAECLSRLAGLQERIRLVEARVARVREEAAEVRAGRVGDEEVAEALALFDPVWEALTPEEQARVVRLLVEGVEYDGSKNKVSVAFQPSGVRALAEELGHKAAKEKSA
jgi:site-specific DNA recombinase